MNRCARGIALLAWLLLLAFTGGCQPSDTHPPADGGFNSSPAAGTDGVPADQILTKMRAVYANAKTYRDDGVLLLSYRKDGLLTEEPQRWSTAWSAGGKLAMEVFGAHLKGDGQRLSCYIYDIDTANLDGQRMVVPYNANQKPPIDEIFADPIASVFVGGFSELPLNETDPLLRGKLVPAPVNLLTGQLHCPWLHAPVGLLERLPDQTLGKHHCYVIRSMAVGMGCDIWIDKASGLLIQMSLPLKLLDPQVMAAPNITELQMLARFENASINTTIDAKTFELQPRKNSTPVKSFVTLPQSLPVESIGQVVDRFRLIQPNGKPIDHLHFDGKPTALLWLGGENSYDSIKSLSRLESELPANQYYFGIIYSDSELQVGPEQPHLVRAELTAAMASSEVPMFYDPGLAASIELAIRDIPSVVLLDGNSRVQFARLIDDSDWSQTLASAMLRVAANEDLAEEMLNQYQKHLSQYQSELRFLDASNLMPTGLLSRQKPKADTGRMAVGELPKRNNAPSLSPRRIWSCKQFRQPGNIASFARNSPVIFVFDGTRSIVTLNASGEVVSRKVLDLPDGTAVSRLRLLDDGSIRAVFTPMGKRIFLFDESWEKVAVFPNAESSFEGSIADAQLCGSRKESWGLTVASTESGLVSVSAKEARLHRFQWTKAAVDSFATGAGNQSAETFFIANQSLYSSAGTLDHPFVKIDQNFRFNLVKDVLKQEQRFYVASGYDESLSWKLVAFSPAAGEPIWTQELGSQFFDSLIEPIARLKTDKQKDLPFTSCIAVACKRNAAHMFSRDGTWLTDIMFADTPRGIALMKIDSQTHLLVSVDDRVECWALE